MKRLTFCLALLAMLIAGTVGAHRIIEVPEAGARTVTMVMGGVASTACATSSSTVPHDTAGAHGWETGDPLSWTLVDTNDPNILVEGASTATYTTGKPTGACDKGLVLTNPDTVDSSDVYVRYNYESAIDIDTTALDMYFYLYVDSLPEANDAFKIAGATGTTTPTNTITALINLENSSGTIHIRGEGATNGATWITVTAQTWTLVKLHLDTTVGNSYISTGGDSACAGGAEDTATCVKFQRNGNDPQYFFLGGFASLGSDEPGTIAFDLFSLDTP